MVLKPFVPVILALGATAAWAVDEAPQPEVVRADTAPIARPAAAAEPHSVGFGMSFDFMLPNDQRFSGTAVSYFLFLPFGRDVEVGLYRQEGDYVGRDGDVSVSGHGHFDAVRATYRFYDDEAQSAKLIAAVGYAQFSNSLSVGAWAFDLGVEYAPWKIATQPVSAEFGVSVTYRYCRFGAVDVFTPASRPVNDAGGFLFGVHLTATF